MHTAKTFGFPVAALMRENRACIFSGDRYERAIETEKIMRVRSRNIFVVSMIKKSTALARSISCAIWGMP